MNYEQIKKHANNILKNKISECNYIEYKKSSEQLSKILKTICAYGNNYYDNDIQYIFIGVEERNDENAKSIPILPITGIDEGYLEKSKNQINSLRPYLYPNVSFDIVVNEFEGRKYLLVIVPRQTGGPFMVTDKAEKDKKINLKPGRYIRFEAESRLARVNEEYDLLRKFSNFHYCSMINPDATIDDLNIDYLLEYVDKVSDKKILKTLGKKAIAKALKLVDKNDPDENRVKNFAILMFALKPERFIPYSFVELIVDMYGTKRKMESKKFSGPIWKQYYNIVNYINNNYLNVCVLREDGQIENRQIANYPFIAIEELVANAIVHNNYENGKPIQIYVSEKQINIVNYNRPLPPLSLKDLNERNVFNERDTENPEIRDMFKSLGIIESFGTGIGEAKKAMMDNGSPKLYYKLFSESDNVTSVVIPVNEEYASIKNGLNSTEVFKQIDQAQVLKDRISKSKNTSKVKENLLIVYKTLGQSTFGNSDVAITLDCSRTTSTKYIKKLKDELGIILPVNGVGKAKYHFRDDLDTKSSPS